MMIVAGSGEATAATGRVWDRLTQADVVLVERCEEVVP